MPTSNQDRDFALQLVSLDAAIDWIQGNLDPDQVFTSVQLNAWALENGFVDPE